MEAGGTPGTSGLLHFPWTWSHMGRAREPGTEHTSPPLRVDARLSPPQGHTGRKRTGFWGPLGLDGTVTIPTILSGPLGAVLSRAATFCRIQVRSESHLGIFERCSLLCAVLSWPPWASVSPQVRRALKEKRKWGTAHSLVSEMAPERCLVGSTHRRARWRVGAVPGVLVRAVTRP